MPFDDRVPRHQYSIFTGHVKVTAVLRLDGNDKEKIAKEFKRDTDLVLDINNIPELVSMVRSQSFEGGDFQETYFNLLDEYLVKTVRAKKWRKAKDDERVQLRDLFYKYAPRIAYFPTSVFEFPEKVFLTNRGSKVDKFYRRVFQDILDHDGQRQTIENDIIRRLHHESLAMPWADFIAAWAKQKDKGFSYILGRCMQVQAKTLVNNGLNNTFNSAITKLVLGKHGYHDKMEQDITSSDESMKPTVIQLVSKSE